MNGLSLKNYLTGESTRQTGQPRRGRRPQIAGRIRGTQALNREKAVVARLIRFVRYEQKQPQIMGRTRGPKAINREIVRTGGQQ